jgi:GNAT superfamily N-acetyltransferase
MREISHAQLASHASPFAGAQLAMALASIAAGNTAGQLWRGEGGAALLWDKGNNVIAIAGPADETSRRAAADVIAAHIRPRAFAEGRPRFKARPLSAAWEAALPELFAGAALRRSRSLFYRYGAAPPAPLEVPGVSFVPIDRALLARNDLAGVEEVREEIASMWPSPELFFSNGLGQAALANGAIACWCTGEYVSATQCGIGIATAPAFQRRGIATATAQRFVSQALGRGLAPHWECSDENAASMRVAEKVGFAPIEAATYWIGLLAERAA